MSGHNRIEKKIITVDEIISHPLNLFYYEITGICEGPTVYIQSSVHGAELQGNLVIKYLMEYFKTHPVAGKIILNPIANPYATSQKVGTYTHGRFNPNTGDNWNRLYHNLITTKEDEKSTKSAINIKKFLASLNINESTKNFDFSSLKKIFKEEMNSKLQNLLSDQEAYGVSDNKNLFINLQLLACHADIVLDLHTAPVATRYIYAPNYLKEDVLHLNFPYVLLIDHEFAGAMDEASFFPWVSLYDELKNLKLINESDYDFKAYTLELGGEEFIDGNAAKQDCQNILNYLNFHNILVNKTNSNTNTISPIFCPLSDYVTYRAKNAGLCEYLVKPGCAYKKGETLMRLHQFHNLEDSISHQDILALEDGFVINHLYSSNVKKGMDLMQCFKKVNKG